MAFVNQVSQADFNVEEIKTLNVLCREEVQEFGDLAIPAPAGVELDVTTGQLNVQVDLELVGPPQIRTIEVLPDKVINMGVVPVRLVVAGVVVIQLLEIPFQGVVECRGARPGDNVQKHDVRVLGTTISPVQVLAVDGVTLTLNLLLKVVIRLCLVVSREAILRVNANKPFC